MVGKIVLKGRLSRLQPLLDFSDDQQRKISDKYGEYLYGNIPTTVQIEIKNFFENLRSLLLVGATKDCSRPTGTTTERARYSADNPAKIRRGVKDMTPEKMGAGEMVEAAGIEPASVKHPQSGLHA